MVFHIASSSSSSSDSEGSEEEAEESKDAGRDDVDDLASLVMYSPISNSATALPGEPICCVCVEKT